AHFEAAFPTLSPLWLSTSAGDDQVLLLTREDLAS
ncbi:MAG: 50S ribosomal protein L3 N(5)-glutamine methyltransferase, partial [Rubrivivax sp.]